ncbi:MAG: RNA polymerase sigma factor [Acidimicrobiales bacterium]
MDEAGFRALFETCFDDVWRFARRRCPAAHAADDVTAETFAVAWRRRADLPEGDGARLWLFGTARLVLANQRRGDGRQSALRDRLAAEPPPGEAADPALTVASSEDGRRVWRSLAALADEDRDLLMMRAWDGLAVTDIATLLDCSPNAASIRLHWAKKRLAAALDEHDPDQVDQGLVGPVATAGPAKSKEPTTKDPARSRTSLGRSASPEGESR